MVMKSLTEVVCSMQHSGEVGVAMVRSIQRGRRIDYESVEEGSRDQIYLGILLVGGMLRRGSIIIDSRTAHVFVHQLG